MDGKDFVLPMNSAATLVAAFRLIPAVILSAYRANTQEQALLA